MLQNTTKAKLADGHAVFGCFVRTAEPSLIEYVGAARLGLPRPRCRARHPAAEPGRGSVPRDRAARRHADGAGHDERRADDPALPRYRRPRRAHPVGQQRGGGRAGGAGGEVLARAAIAGWPAAGHPNGVSASRSATYVERANRETLVVIQVETQAAVDAIDEYLAIDGVDVLFLGPTDLSQSLGHPGDLRHPDVLAALDRVAIGGRRVGQGPRDLRRHRGDDARVAGPRGPLLHDVPGAVPPGRDEGPPRARARMTTP